MAVLEEKFVVFNIKDIDEYLSTSSKANLVLMEKAIQLGREKDGKKGVNNYYVCNQDEPYAQQVIDIILAGETEKENNEIKN